MHRKWNHSLHELQCTDPPLAREDVIRELHVGQVNVGPGLVSMSPASKRRRDSMAGSLNPFREKTGNPFEVAHPGAAAEARVF